MLEVWLVGLSWPGSTVLAPREHRRILATWNIKGRLPWGSWPRLFADEKKWEIAKGAAAIDILLIMGWWHHQLQPSLHSSELQKRGWEMKGGTEMTASLILSLYYKNLVQTVQKNLPLLHYCLPLCRLFVPMHLKTACAHCKQDPIYVFPEMKLHSLVPNFHSRVSVSDL